MLVSGEEVKCVWGGAHRREAEVTNDPSPRQAELWSPSATLSFGDEITLF